MPETSSHPTEALVTDTTPTLVKTTVPHMRRSTKFSTQVISLQRTKDIEVYQNIQRSGHSSGYNPTNSFPIQ
jgi:hypothetical protein